MARYDIMSKDGLTVRYKGAPKYNGTFGQPSYLEFAEIASPVPIEWEVGDYVDYDRTGFRYKLYGEPQVVKSGTIGSVGDAFVYKNVQFHCATKDLEIALFRDIVEYDNGIHFSSIPNVDTYEDVYGIIRRIQANMDDFAPGKWTIRAMDTSVSEIVNLMSEVKAFSLSDGTCMDALNQIYSLWRGISWVYKVENGRHTIVLGRPNLQDASNTTPEFSFGHGNGLKVLTRQVSTKNEIATRIYAYGSDRNMPTRFYNNLEPAIKDNESVYIPHLMLPLSYWGSTGGQKDARLAYIENASAIARYGLIPKILRFDGTGDMDDIYPSVEGMTVGDVADSDFPGTGWLSTDRIDEVVAADNPLDVGEYTEDSKKLKENTLVFPIAEIEKTYETKDRQEAVTIANDQPLVTTRGDDSAVNPPYLSEAGRFTIEMNGVRGRVFCEDSAIGIYLTDVPKTFIDVFVGGKLQTSKEAKVISTKMQDDFMFECDTIKFTTDDRGHLDIYVRIEMPLRASTPALEIQYTVAETEVKVDVEYSIDDTFKLYLRQLGFDISAMGSGLSDGLCTINMRSGNCAGRDFVVESAVYNEDTHEWELVCRRQDDTSLMQYFPNDVYSIQAGDRFVLTDLQMPSKYVYAAMNRLLEAASKALEHMSVPKKAYVPEVDSKEVFLADVDLVEGLYMPVYDEDLIETQIPAEPHVNWILIASVTIAENDDVIPIYSVTLRDEKVESMLQTITGELNEALKRLRDHDVDESRIPAREEPEAVLIPTVVGVKIQAESKLFVSDSAGNYTGQTITLTAVTSGINLPSYQWYYYDVSEEEWVALNDETDQAYIVSATDASYFPEGVTNADFKVIVTDGEDTIDPDDPEGEPIPAPTYEDVVRISKGGRGPAGPPGTDGDPGEPGDDGISKATIYLYRRFPTGTPSSTRVGNTTYTFATQTLVGTLNGWQPTIPTGSGPVYVTMTSVASQDASVDIAGGWVTDVPAGAWSVPARLTGENGLMGKVMRGVNVWEEGGLDGGRPDGVTDGYQGMDEADPSVIFYDVVARVDENGNITAYYYCKDGSDGNAALYAPWSQQGADYWVEAENFDFIATKVLLAENAFIDILSGNAVYLYDNDGPASGDIVAGIQGGSEDALGNDQVNFFAGATNPQEAPFRVYYDGSFVSTAGQIGGYTYDEDGLTYYRNAAGSNDGYRCIYQKDSFEIQWRSQGRVNSVIGDVMPTADQVMKIQQGFSSSKPALVVQGYSGSSPAMSVTGLVDVSGDFRRMNLNTSSYESVVTSVDGNILRVAKMTQTAYDALVTKASDTLYIIVEATQGS